MGDLVKIIQAALMSIIVVVTIVVQYCIIQEFAPNLPVLGQGTLIVSDVGFLAIVMLVTLKIFGITPEQLIQMFRGRRPG